MKIGFLGCGKIGKKIIAYGRERGCEVAFVQDPFYKEKEEFPVVEKGTKELYAAADLIIECATAVALKENFDEMIAAADVLIFSLTAFSDPEFSDRAMEQAEKRGHHIFFPHGAILGLDGIFDARSIITAASVVTTKNPKSLGLGADIKERTVVYEGSARGACAAFPRNVNVHAAVAMAGIGFDRTISKIIADPFVSTNAHHIVIDGEGIHFEIQVSSFTTGGVTGMYTPLSACGSLERLTKSKNVYSFI